MDNPAAHETFAKKYDRLNNQSPRAILTPFGWCVVGPVNAKVLNNPQCYHLANGGTPELDDLFERFYDNDAFGVKQKNIQPVSADDKRALQILKQTTRFIGDRYESGLLWRQDVPALPNNRIAAEKRFSSLERRFKTNPELAKKYAATINEYVALGHAKKLSSQESISGPPGRTWWLPHHPVFNQNKPGKIRVVFDAAATYQGISLNSALLKGPDLLTSLIGVLLRFRQFPIAINADIVKMFHQVKVREVDGPAFRFIWREPGSTHPPQDYQMQVQIFGAVSSPTVCAYALRQAAIDAGKPAEAVLEQVLNNFYVDNWLSSFRTTQEAVEVVKMTSATLSRGGFELSQWGSSHSEVLGIETKGEHMILNLDLDYPPMERTLGLWWDSCGDAFKIRFNVKPGDRTKRQLLRTLASIFDPLDFLVPVTMVAKVLIQQVWRNKCDWDEELPPALLAKWDRWASSFDQHRPINIQRCLTPVAGKWLHADLHVFSDASETGYGAVSYLRFETSSETKVCFVMAKSRVAPLKLTTVPRLELCAAVMATRLALTVVQELRIEIRKTIFHTDSITVLRWIYSPRCRFHTYVGNRIAEIQDSTTPNQWRFVPGLLNPADEASRGLLANELHQNHRFLRGCPFLLQHQRNWPESPELLAHPIDQSDPEVRNVPWVGVVGTNPNEIDDLIKRVSRESRLIRSMAFVFRFTRNVRIKQKTRRNTSALSAEEIRLARHFLITHTQKSAFEKEFEDLRAGRKLDKTSRILKLSPFIDTRGVLCVGGRLENAPVPLDSRHPIILPSEARFTSLLLQQMHVNLAHASAERTLHEARKTYWVIRGRPTLKGIVAKCFRCRKLASKPPTPKMAALPACRLQPGQPAFTRTGVDYFGPIEVIIFRRKVKRWGCIFTCMTTRAVHLEMAYHLDTDAFLSALLRFEQRRGVPAAYYSDNGTNFVGANSELQECIKRMDQKKITEKLSLRLVEWHFNPPSAPHFGGAWESLVKSAKRALTTILNRQAVTDEILVTALTIVENLLNGRPLTYLVDDAGELSALTPHQLLTGRANPNMPSDVFDESDLSFKKRWRFAESLATGFWRRWMKEYLPTMAERKKWFGKQTNLCVGDIAVILDPNTPRSRWPLGRITRTISGKDGTVRSAFVKIRDSELHRPAVKICPLPDI